MEINNKFNITQTVFVITDTSQYSRIVTGIIINPNNTILYRVSFGEIESIHYEFELSEDRDVLKTIG